jgi:hypothetical protein
MRRDREKKKRYGTMPERGKHKMRENPSVRGRANLTNRRRGTGKSVKERQHAIEKKA